MDLFYKIQKITAMKIRFFIVLFVSVLFVNSAKSDSPITSTNFYTAYLDIEMVKYASESNGILNDKMCKYLEDKSVDVVYKLAVINAISWDFNGKNNFELYLDYICENNKKISHSNYKEKCSDIQLICLAYLKAMDNYFEVKEALEIADLTIEKHKKICTVSILFTHLSKSSLLLITICVMFTKLQMMSAKTLS